MDIVGYEDRVAMFVCGEYSAFFQLEEVKEGKFVPVKLLSVRSKEDSHWWDVDTAFHVMKWHKKNQLVSPIYQEVNVYREIIKEKAEFQKYVPWEKDFLKRVECIHFYEKENGEKTIVALKKSKWIKGKFDGYIKKIHIPNNFYDSEKKAVVLELLTAIDGYNKEPRKTPVGVEEYRRDESIGKHKFPWSISLYKGENRILIIPYLDHAAGFGQQPDKMVILEENASALEIGKGIGEVIEIIKTSPRLAGNTEGYRLATRYKGWKAFSKRNKLISIEVYEDFSYRLVAEEAKKGDGIYHTVMEAKKIDASVT
ncbi:MAG: hypothetical protein IJF07_06075, partial [Lachnospiraceae bacterium]|nr:hypothetical protein [Lachnospiraceae bacterium]